MNDANNDSSGEKSTEDHSHQQAIEYGKDLARVYAAEKARRKELETAYSLLDAIFNSIPDGLVVLDGDCVIQRTNPAFDNLLNSGSPSSIGLHLNDLSIGPSIFPLLMQIESVSFGSLQTEIELQRPKARVLLANIAPLRLQTFDGWVIVLHDHTPTG
jgi:PAS domain-containing protein